MKKMCSRFLHITKVIALKAQQKKLFCSNFKTKTVYLTPPFSFNSPPLLGARPTDKLSVIKIEEKVTSSTH